MITDQVQKESSPALVSVVITTYNHAIYLPDAIESVLGQTYPYTELIVIDDGSTDNTKNIAGQYSQVNYFFQENMGLSAARNTGVLKSKGQYIVFLDADDMLYPNMIATGMKYFRRYPKCGFISGAHDIMSEDKQIVNTKEWQRFPSSDFYEALLRCDYISMHGAVIYSRDVFDHHQYDETLSSCEDYDFYLQIAENYPIYSHNEKLAAYRKHGQSMSRNTLKMYNSAINVLNKHCIRDKRGSLKDSWHQGRKDVKAHYAAELFHDLTYPGRRVNFHLFKEFITMAAISWKYLWRFIGYCFFSTGKWIIKKLSSSIRWGYRLVSRSSRTFIPGQGKINMADLRSIIPFSTLFGYDRGGPVDRYYIERFLMENTQAVKGHVLEVGDNDYTIKFGGDRVNKSEILYIDESNEQATIIGDLSNAGHIPSDQFDCIILTQTLHLIYDFHAALKHSYRILKKGGVLLLTVPGVTPIDHGEWGDTWYWGFTGNAIRNLLNAYFDPFNVRVSTYGNVLAATAFLFGMGKTELIKSELDHNDPSYQVIITAKAIKR